MLVDAASLGEARASWRRSSVVAILAGGGGVLEVGFETVHVVVVVVGCKRITLIRSLGKASFGRSFPRTTFCARPSMIDDALRRVRPLLHSAWLVVINEFIFDDDHRIPNTWREYGGYGFC